MPKIPSLANEQWLNAEPLQRLLHLLSAGDGEARVAGGAVRNALLGEPIADIDIATTLPPWRVSELVTRAGMSVHPTGLDHGTVTVVIHDGDETHTFEITTLRVDTETDGRRAKVAFTDDWVADASRRDFTINAMFCDADGNVNDPLGGYSDLDARVVRFAGDAHARITEDHLRILRFFRFHARYGTGDVELQIGVVGEQIAVPVEGDVVAAKPVVHRGPGRHGDVCPARGDLNRGAVVGSRAKLHLAVSGF